MLFLQGVYYTLKGQIENYNHPLRGLLLGFKNNLPSFTKAVKRTIGQLIDSVLDVDFHSFTYHTFVPPRPKIKNKPL